MSTTTTTSTTRLHHSASFCISTRRLCCLVPLLVLLTTTLHTTRAAGTPQKGGALLSPFSVGMRAAVGNSIFSKHSSSSSATRSRRQRVQLAQQQQHQSTFLVSKDEKDDRAMETALLRTSSLTDMKRSRQTRSAYLHTWTTSTSQQQQQQQEAPPQSELEFLESNAQSCSRITTPTSRVLEAAGSTPTSTTLSLSRGLPQQQQLLQQPELRMIPNSNSAVVGSRGGAKYARPLVFWENMICGAISRSVAQTVMHPANTMKTILQSSKSPPRIRDLIHPSNFRRLTCGAGANFILSVPHGAVNFAVLEFVRKRLGEGLNRINPALGQDKRLSPGLDFLSSCISTITCSAVSTPQMVITDNIMAGNYPNLYVAITTLARKHGVRGFYRGWWPGLVGKIPSYALTWTFFQQLKVLRDKVTNHRPATDIENSAMGCLASATTVCIMIPMDTIKTRLVTQAGIPEYKGIIDCATRIFKEEGIGAFYRGLPPRLVSVVPMIGIQFGVYEFTKRIMIERTIKNKKLLEEAKLQKSNNNNNKKELWTEPDDYTSEQVLKEAAMEVAASPEHPYPAPHFHDWGRKKAEQDSSKMISRVRILFKPRFSKISSGML